MSQQFQRCRPSQMTRDAFINAFAAIYEHSPWIAVQAWDRGLHAEHDQIDRLHRLMSDILLNSDHQAQLDLIKAHPDLAGPAALAGELTAASSAEQSGAGIRHSSADELARFSQLNAAYNAKFGFPFIKAVTGSSRAQILEAFEQRRHNNPEDEFARALREINKIALFRLQTL